MARKALARFALTLATAASVCLAFSPAALAQGKPGGGGTGSSVALVLLNSTDGLPHWGQQVTFTVQTSSTRPWVKLDCYQGSTWVYTASAGFFADYPWGTTYTLSSNSWTGGAANCHALLYTTRDGSKITTLAKLDFVAYP